MRKSTLVAPVTSPTPHRNGLTGAQALFPSLQTLFNGLRTAKGFLFPRKCAGSRDSLSELRREGYQYQPGPGVWPALPYSLETVGKLLLLNNTEYPDSNTGPHHIGLGFQSDVAQGWRNAFLDIFHFSEAASLLADFLLSFSPFLFSFPCTRHLAAIMGSPRAEQQGVELTGENAPGVGVGETGKQGAGTSIADATQVDAGDGAALHTTGVQQLGAGNQPENERQDAVFGAIEVKLKEQDERECLLAEAYRDSKEKSKKTAKKALDRLGYKPVESDEDANDDDSCYIEIRNLVLIEDSVIHKKALEEWDRKQELFASRVERKSTKVESRKNEVYQLIGFFSVFQGVVLTAVSQSNLLYCNNRWSPILLSLLASIVTIAGVYQKLMQISSLEKTIFSESEALKDVVHRGQALRREGKNFVFAKFSEGKKKEWKEDYSTWWFHQFSGIGKNPRTAMTKITLKNDLKDKDVKIREGNAGNYRKLTTLKPGKTFDIHNDPNATYREYVFITFPDNTKLKVLTSDDFAEYTKISIFEEDGEYDWTGTANRGNPAQGGPIQRILHKFGLM